MAYYTIAPPHHLKKYVRFYWVLESDKPYYIHRSMADVCPEMVFHYRGQFDELKQDGTVVKSSLSGIQGPANKVSWFQIEESFGIFGVYLYPYTLQSLLKIPSEEIINLQLNLFELLGTEGRELEEKMLESVDNIERLGIINSYLEKKLNKCLIQDSMYDAVHLIMNAKGNIKVKELCNTFCLSERQFERKFKKASGMNPKLFSKIIRFHNTFNEMMSSSCKSLTEVAYENNYYDQSHFINEFKTFSGLCPKEFLSRKAPGLDWISN